MGEGNLKFEEVNVAGHAMQKHTRGEVFVLPEPTLMVISEEFALRPILERGADADAKEIIATLSGADLKSTILWLGTVKHLKKQQREAMLGKDEMTAPFLREMEQFVIEINVTDKVAATARLYYPDADTATKIKTNIVQFIELMKVVELEGSPPAFKNAMASAKVSSEGAHVTITGELSAKDVLSLLPAMLKEPGAAK